ncbi:hypothetical protein COUCH_24525 [Couchioplanes caeruleus]|uniref:hypothetical protein n=1 Tax=Couchioplanes caeruleus TaxID=56438 RepID=UPI0020BE05BD|nr:hypothetical protein [Couchioplanes caeruleus]UQU62197.1 hypothetical protein COUCH_24525 [Couchioplanes caeruleus]
MATTVSSGIVPRTDQCVLASGPASRAAVLPAGTPVALGPADAPDEAREAALAELRALVDEAGPLAAAAGADLGGGFRSARVDGRPGDRRDAVLAALAVPRYAERLGPPAALLVALFGPDATRPLGAETLAAIAAGHWAALRYAVAAGDLLGPEQLVEVLRLRAADGIDPFPLGLPSVVGDHLARVLRPLPRPRRLALLVSLWEQVCDALTERRRRERIRSSQTRRDLEQPLAERRERYEEMLVERALGPRATVAEAALWYPPRRFWEARFRRVLHDALAATVLARVAATAADLGVEAALDRHGTHLRAAAALLSGKEAAAAARRVPGLTGHPARPGCYVRDIAACLGPGATPTAKQLTGIRQRLSTARHYGTAAVDAATSMLGQAPYLDHPSALEAMDAVRAAGMADWRDEVGYFSPQRPATWRQPTLDGRPVLADRPEPAETVGDLLWLGELADAVAQLYGHPAAGIDHWRTTVTVDFEPDPSVDTFVSDAGSVAQAAARAAQLAEFGGAVPARPRSWGELVAGLVAGAAAAEALVATFAVPAVAGDTDGTLLPGTGACIEVARTGSQLGDWAAYMGNCIAGPYYSAEAAAGHIVLLALRDAGGRILLNAELRPTGKGWRTGEVRARFNEDPDPKLLRHLQEWVRSLPLPLPAEAAPEPDPAPRTGRAPRRPAPARRLAAELGERLEELTGERQESTFARLLGVPATPEGLVALRRQAPPTVERAVRDALADPAAAGEVWAATAVRPMAAAVAAMPEDIRGRLAPLVRDEPLPAALRKIARLPRVAPARTADLVALRVRAAFGALLRADDAALAAAMTRRPHGPLLRAAALAVTTWGGLTGPAVTAVAARRRVRLPGYPESSLRDETWQGAWPDAIELGADPDAFWTGIARHGLLLPASWLGAGWPALWARSSARPAPRPRDLPAYAG